MGSVSEICLSFQRSVSISGSWMSFSSRSCESFVRISSIAFIEMKLCEDKDIFWESKLIMNFF